MENRVATPKSLPPLELCRLRDLGRGPQTEGNARK
jgi:hypothetical protein